MKSRNDGAYQEIRKGADLCRRLKQMTMPTTSWSRAICDKLAVKFTELKRKGRILYPHLPEAEMLAMLDKYTDDDLREFVALHLADNSMAIKC